MASQRTLFRLKRIRELEEEQRRLDLEFAQSEMEHLRKALRASRTRNRNGQRLVLDSIHSDDLAERLAGLEESRMADRRSRALLDRLEHTESEVARLREKYLSKRVERRQIECLIEQALSREIIEAGRRSQQALDDRHGYRSHRARNGRREIQRDNENGISEDALT